LGGFHEVDIGLELANLRSVRIHPIRKVFCPVLKASDKLLFDVRRSRGEKNLRAIYLDRPRDRDLSDEVGQEGWTDGQIQAQPHRLRPGHLVEDLPPGDNNYRVCPTAFIPETANPTLSSPVAGWHL
jgi:hypothetical protein